MKHKRGTRSCKSCHVQQDNTARRQSKRQAHLTTHRKFGKYVHGMCGVQDPESSNECHRICGLKCLPAAQQPAGKGKPAAHRRRTTPLSSSNAGSTFSAKSGNAGAPSKKSAGGQTSSNLTLNKDKTIHLVQQYGHSSSILLHSSQIISFIAV